MMKKIKVGPIFKSIVSNQAVIDTRKYPWYIALVIFLLTVFVPWIPSLSRGYTANTASLLTASQNYDLDKGFKYTLSSDYFKEILITKKDGSYTLSYDFKAEDYTDDSASYANEYNATNPVAMYHGNFTDDNKGQDNLHSTTAYSKEFSTLTKDYYFDAVSSPNNNSINPAKTSSSSSSTTAYENNGRNYFLLNYYIPELSKSEEKYSLFLNNFVSSVILNMDATGKANSYPHSYAIWAKDFVLIAVYPLRSSTSSLSVAGSYSGFINDGFSDQEVVDGTSFYTYLAGSETDINTIYTTSFVHFMDEAGRPTYLRSVWVNIGVLSAVVAGSILIASLILLIFNKRKASIYRDTNYWECIKEAIYLSFTPALLAMIFGFINSQYVMVIIIGGILIRVVFMMNRICPPANPDGDSSNKPLYQARS